MQLLVQLLVVLAQVQIFRGLRTGVPPQLALLMQLLVQLLVVLAQVQIFRV